MRKILLLSIGLMVAAGVKAQHSSNAYRSLADSLYEHHHYSAAAEYYEKALKKAADPGAIMLQVGKCYQKVNDLPAAAEWFGKAKTAGAVFSTEETYHYARVLVTLQRRTEAEAVLAELLAKDPNALLVRQALKDIRHFQDFYRDSARYKVVSLPINTTVSEFAPAFYKDGIVFSAATQESFAKKKYHWDNSHYLNLYYSPIVNGQVQKPLLFEKNLNTKFHDGPASFYDNGEKMIVNRNQPVKSHSEQDTWVWHLSLYDAQRATGGKSGWTVTPLPFDTPPYAAAHPAVSEDGNTLYFVSDKPGGYGGTDIYRTVRVNGAWSEPFNLGPNVNSVANEVFPFMVHHTLYFASNGRGGLGGLDIFKSDLTVNGFTPPENLGYPVNTTADDFSLITAGDQYSGYFASARNGNDDLFSFRKQPVMIPALAQIFDGVTRQPLAGATVQLLTSSGDDITLTSDSDGNVRYQLPEETAYMMVGTGNGKTGMMTGMAVPDEDEAHMTHRIPAYGDTSRVACVGFIKNAEGVARQASRVAIVDENTGEKILSNGDPSVVSFLGEKDHAYRVVIENADGDTTVHRVQIAADDNGAKSWNMLLKERPASLVFAARVFDATTGQPLPDADVKIITFSEPDKELKADAAGMVEFALTPGAAYMVIGSKDNLTGMHSGTAEPGADKSSVIHPVPAHGDPPPAPAVVLAVVTNEQGDVLANAEAIVTDKATGERVAVTIEDGVMSFAGERGKQYNISVSHEGHETTLEEISIPKEGADVEKISVVLHKAVPATYLMAARVFKAADHSPLAGAAVKIISFAEADQELTAGSDGVVEFSLPEGTTYMVIGSKDGFVGMHSGIVAPGTEKASVVHPVPATDEPEKQLPVLAYITNAQGEPISGVTVTVIEKKTGKKVQATVKDGLVSFIGIKGKSYSVTVSHQDHLTVTASVDIPGDAVDARKVSIAMDDKPSPAPKQLPMVVSVTDKQGNIISDATAVVTEKNTGRIVEASVKQGIVTFQGDKGGDYVVTASHDDHETLSQHISVAPQATASGKAVMVMERAASRPAAIPGVQETPAVLEMAVRVFKAADQTPLGGANVKVISFVQPDQELTANGDGVAVFTLPEGTTYMVVGTKDQYVGMHSGMAENGSDRHAITHPVPALDEPLKQLPILGRITNRAGDVLADALVTVTQKSNGRKLTVTVQDGLFSFTGEKGESYSVEVAHKDHVTQVQVVEIPEQATESGKVSFILEGKDIAAPASMEIAVRVFKASDKTPLPGAQVKVISFVAPDQELIANAEGIAVFSLPEDLAFMVVASKDGYVGMYTGLSEKGTDKKSMIHPVPATQEEAGAMIVAARVVDERGNAVAGVRIEVVEKETGKAVAFTEEDGIVRFMGEKGKTYVVKATEGQRAAEGSVVIDRTATEVASHTLVLPDAATPANAAAPLIVMHTDEGTSRIYLHTPASFGEITEKDGMLYWHDAKGTRALGTGTLAKLQQDPAPYLRTLGVRTDRTITLRNIYFDYNKAVLDDEDMRELENVKEVLIHYPALRLMIQAHADDRGGDAYNLNLSKRRAGAVGTFLSAQGVAPRRIITRAFGESLPVVPCASKNCSEDDHQKNRRAEFVLTMQALPSDDGVRQPVYFDPKPKTNNAGYGRLLQLYGDKNVSGVVFKVSVGAYRYNDSLSFDNLKDLGSVEKLMHGGITYYYLAAYNTLREAEAVRKQVIERGVADAGITIFHNGEKINWSSFTALLP